MSVFTQRHMTEFYAPLSIDQTKVALHGSWSDHSADSTHDLKFSGDHLFHLRLHTWIQQLKNTTAETCLDWCIKREGTAMVHYVIVRFNSNLPCFRQCINSTEFNTFIGQVLNSNAMIWSVCTSIHQSCSRHVVARHVVARDHRETVQQLQPGEGSVGVSGKKGREGLVSQSL
jgi:hypothetical protein